MVRELQPNAMIFSDAGLDARWVGNESGYAGDTCWATYTPRGPSGTAPAPGNTIYEDGEWGHRDGKFWMPAEVDVSIRPGWFYHAAEDRKVRSGANLAKLYYQSIGRGASLLLNLPPDRRGLVHEKDVESLREFRRIIDATFARNLAPAGPEVRVLPARGGVAEMELSWPNPVKIDTISLREHLPLGQRVDSWAIDRCDGDWRCVAAGASIGARRIWRGPAFETARLRARFMTLADCVALREVGVYAE